MILGQDPRFGAHGGATVFVTTNGGRTWSSHPAPTDGGLSRYLPADLSVPTPPFSAISPRQMVMFLGPALFRQATPTIMGTSGGRDTAPGGPRGAGAVIVLRNAFSGMGGGVCSRLRADGWNRPMHSDRSFVPDDYFKRGSSLESTFPTGRPAPGTPIHWSHKHRRPTDGHRERIIMRSPSRRSALRTEVVRQSRLRALHNRNGV